MANHLLRNCSLLVHSFSSMYKHMAPTPPHLPSPSAFPSLTSYRSCPSPSMRGGGVGGSGPPPTHPRAPCWCVSSSLVSVLRIEVFGSDLFFLFYMYIFLKGIHQWFSNQYILFTRCHSLCFKIIPNRPHASRFLDLDWNIFENRIVNHDFFLWTPGIPLKGVFIVFNV